MVRRWAIAPRQRSQSLCDLREQEDGGRGCAGGLSSTQTADEEVKLYSPGFFRVSQSLQKPYTALQPKKVSHCARLVTRCREMLELMQTGDFNKWCAHGADCRGDAIA